MRECIWNAGTHTLHWLPSAGTALSPSLSLHCFCCSHWIVDRTGSHTSENFNLPNPAIHLFLSLSSCVSGLSFLPHTHHQDLRSSAHLSRHWSVLTSSLGVAHQPDPSTHNPQCAAIIDFSTRTISAVAPVSYY